MECARGCFFVCQYYPTCPEPALTFATGKHSDAAFLTILLQDQLGGLLVIHESQWVNVLPIAGGLVVNIGDLLRVLANCVGSRIYVASFYTGGFVPPKLYYGPIKELISEENPPIYREVLRGIHFHKPHLVINE